MNRRQRRAGAGRPAGGDSDAALLHRAIAQHQAGRLAEAEGLYRQILSRRPEHPDALHLLGVLAGQSGRTEQAVRLIRRAIARAPGIADYHANLGPLLQAQGDMNGAAESLRRALALAPQHVKARINLGSVLLDAGNAAAALIELDVAASRAADLPMLHCLRGRALGRLGREPEAMAALRRAGELDSRHVPALTELTALALDRNEPEAAQWALDRLVEFAPNHENRQAHFELGRAWLRAGDLDRASEAFLAPVRRLHTPGRPPPPGHALPDEITVAKLEHDVEQFEWLAGKGVAGAAALAATYREALAQLPAALGDAVRAPLPALLQPLIGDSLNRLVHFDGPAALDGPALDPAIDGPALEAAYCARTPGLVFVDRLLSDAALAGLRRFCLDSTIWWQTTFTDEVGSSLRNGFCCPLLLQVAEELRALLPGLLSHRELHTLWGYMYYRNRSGLDIHADHGGVSVNFWLTPDEANEDPESGGLYFWDRGAPADFFTEQSHDRKAAMLWENVSGSGATRTTLPYGCNRAAIFNSDIIHQTMPMRFRDGYGNRRINITMIFGEREAG